MQIHALDLRFSVLLMNKIDARIDYTISISFRSALINEILVRGTLGLVRCVSYESAASKLRLQSAA